MALDPRTPIVRTEADVQTHAGQTVYVEGVYEQKDVRRMQVDPPTLYLGHVVLRLADGCQVFLLAPERTEARRPEAEIRRFEHHRVRALGSILPRIPQRGAVQIAPCLVDLRSIEPLGQD